MKNSYIVDGKNVVDIIFDLPKRGKTKIRYFLLEDGTKIKANRTLMKIKCSICNTWHEYKFSNRYENKIYVCGSCRVKGELNPFFGKKHSQEFKDRLSNERKGIWYVGEKNPMFGKPCYYKMTEDEKQEWKDAIRKTMNIPGKSTKGRKMSEFMTEQEILIMKQHQLEHTFKSFPIEKQKSISQKLSKVQRELQKKDPIAYSEMKARGGRATTSKAQHYQKTKPEIKLEEFLKQNNVEYDYSCIMGSKERCFQYDFIIRHRRILIEVQGNYWHGHPDTYNEDGSDGKKKLNKIQLQNIKKDKLKEQFAIEKNFKLIHIWESEINNGDFSKILEIL